MHSELWPDRLPKQGQCGASARPHPIAPDRLMLGGSPEKREREKNNGTIRYHGAAHSEWVQPDLKLCTLNSVDDRTASRIAQNTGLCAGQEMAGMGPA